MTATLSPVSPFELSAAPEGIALALVSDRASLPEQLQSLEGNIWALRVPEEMRPKDVIAIQALESGALVIHCGAGSRTRISLEVNGSGKRSVALHVLVGDEADCELTCAQLMESNGTCTFVQTAVLGEGAALRSRHASLGASESDHEVRCTLAGRSSRSDIEWMCYAKGAERYVLRAFNVFDAPEGAGEIIMRGVAEQKAHLTERGTIVIGLKGNGTNTYLTQEVLMLDKTAKVDAVPGLEIRTNDVKASHSATVARVTEEDLFYFASRGIPAHEARRMFVLGFLGSLLERMGDEGLRGRVQDCVETKYDRA